MDRSWCKCSINMWEKGDIQGGKQMQVVEMTLKNPFFYSGLLQEGSLFQFFSSSRCKPKLIQ